MKRSESKSARTIVLKLFKPGLRKREIIDDAILNYSKAFQYLLESAYMDIENISSSYKDSTGRYRADFISKWVSKELDKKLNEFNIEPFKDSIKIDFAATLAGYLNLKLKDSTAEYPSSNITRALFFCRYSIKRNYSLLYNPEKDRYFAKIYLMNVKSEKRRSLTQCDAHALYYIDKNREIFKESSGKKCFLLFPLSFGKWQEKQLKEVIEKPETIKTARLTKRKNEYYLSINLVKERPEKIKTANYIGITRGIDNTINYAIVDEAGNFIDMGFKKNNNNSIHINDIHAMANSFVEIAKENRCQVIMERLVNRGDGLFWKEEDGKCCFPSLSMYWYNQLCTILNYKLPDNGLPEIIKVSGINIFYTCPQCGMNSKKNRFSGEMLICTNCGKTIDIEKAGCLNLARRLIKFKNDKIKIKVERNEKGIGFVNTDLGLEFYPENPNDCALEFKEKINSLIEDFYNNINTEYKKDNFKKRLSFIKRLEESSNIFDLLEII